MPGTIEVTVKLSMQPVAHIPIAVATTGLATAMRLAYPAFVQVRRDKLECLVWIVPFAHLDQVGPPERSAISDTRECLLYANHALQTILALEADGQTVQLENVAISQWSVMSALIEDLPEAFEADLPRSRQTDCGAGKWVLLSSAHCSMPVRPRWRSQNSDCIRLSLISRVLLNPLEAEAKLTAVQLQPLPKAAWRLFPKSSFYRWRSSGLDRKALFEGIKSGPSVLCDSLVRWIIGGNTLYLRTIEADPGDDTYHLLRLSAAAFDLLGIVPGDQVEVSWADRRTFGIALMAQPATVEGDISQVERVHTRVDHGLPSGLAIGISAKMRAALGIPRRTAVKVRRRAFPLFLKHINQLTIPALGLYLAALTISGISASSLAVGLFSIIVLLLVSLRHPRPPKGLW